MSISARVRAMENRLLTRERLERMIDARDDGEALKVLAECGYGEWSVSNSAGLERALGAARDHMFRELTASVPDRRLVDLFRIKYDYHNAKVLIKAEATGQDPARLLTSGGRYDPELLQDVQECGETFAQAVAQARECMEATGDPQQVDLLLDRACYAEMGSLAKDCRSEFLQGYVRLAVDVANLRSWVRCTRIEKGPEFLAQVLMEGGNVPVSALTQGQDVAGQFRSGLLSTAAGMAADLAQPGAGSLTAFERECDNALMAYQEKARRTPFGEEVVAGYLFAREAELTAIRTVIGGRMAGLEGDVIRQRLRTGYV